MMHNVTTFSSKPHFAGKTHRVLVVDDKIDMLNHGIMATKEAAKSVGIDESQIKLKLVTTADDASRPGVTKALLKRFFPLKTGDGSASAAVSKDKDKVVIYTARDAHQALGILKHAQEKHKPINIQILDNQMPKLQGKPDYLVSSQGESPFVIKEKTIPALSTDAEYSTANAGIWSLSEHRNAGITKPPKTFIFSGTIDDQVRQDALNYGGAACIEKPGKKADLQKAITDHFRAARTAVTAFIPAVPTAEVIVRQEHKSPAEPDKDKQAAPPSRHADSVPQDADTPSSDDQAQLAGSLAKLEVDEKASSKAKVQDDPE